MEPNETSLVLSVRLGEALAILGSDLEVGASAGSGWAAVLSAAAFPSSPSHAFKVPHHGSAGAYHREAWANLVTTDDTVAVLTPYARGRTSLPTDADLARIKTHAAQVYVTAPRPARGTVGDPMVRRTVNEVAREFRVRGAKLGHVRVRMAAAAPNANVERFGAAFAA
jgi:beta-lactamase superfamily II metal-dependent hydrolase